MSNQLTVVEFDDEGLVLIGPTAYAGSGSLVLAPGIAVEFDLARIGSVTGAELSRFAIGASAVPLIERVLGQEVSSHTLTAGGVGHKPESFEIHSTEVTEQLGRLALLLHLRHSPLVHRNTAWWSAELCVEVQRALDAGLLDESLWGPRLIDELTRCGELVSLVLGSPARHEPWAAPLAELADVGFSNIDPIDPSWEFFERAVLDLPTNDSTWDSFNAAARGGDARADGAEAERPLVSIGGVRDTAPVAVTQSVPRKLGATSAPQSGRYAVAWHRVPGEILPLGEPHPCHAQFDSDTRELVVQVALHRDSNGLDLLATCGVERLVAEVRSRTDGLVDVVHLDLETARGSVTLPESFSLRAHTIVVGDVVRFDPQYSAAAVEEERAAQSMVIAAHHARRGRSRDDEVQRAYDALQRARRLPLPSHAVLGAMIDADVIAPFWAEVPPVDLGRVNDG